MILGDHQPRLWRAPFRLVIAGAVVLLLALSSAGCVYFNTFYHAKKSFNEGERVRRGATGSFAAGKNHYERAIEKASRIVERHLKSKYHDDALFMIGVSYFYIANYTKAQNAFRELLATHPESDLTEESRLYLARCRMEQGEERAGFRAFTELARTARKDEWRAEAIYQRGLYFYKNEIYDSSYQEFQIVLNDYEKSERVFDSRVRSADALRKLGRQDEAIELYRYMTRDDDKPLLQLRGLTGIGESWYESGYADSGVAIFAALADDDRFEDSIGTIRLALARGLTDLKDYAGAWRQYEQTVAAHERTRWSAEAYFRMAEIKQFQEDDLLGAKELYDQSRGEVPTGEIAQLALVRSATITTLEQFRQELGRGALTRGGGSLFGDAYVYELALMPRMERDIAYSPVDARPADYISPLLAIADSISADSLAIADSLAASTLAEADSVTVPAEELGPPTDLAVFLGPPVDSADIAFNENRQYSLPDAYWLSLYGVDSAFGPPSPAYLYPFGEGGLLGPSTPDDSVLHRWAIADIDTAAERIRAELETARLARQDELEKIRSSAGVQMQLAELYRFLLNAPDSALVEYQNLTERYPNTPYAAKAMLGAADVLIDDIADTAAGEAYLQQILTEYPYSDYAGEVIERLGLTGTAADTAHPALVYREAENLYLNEDSPRQAIRALEDFLNQYPDSRLAPNAEFAILTLREKYYPAEDSTLILAYQEIESKRPNTVFAAAAAEKLNFVVVRPQRRQRRIVPTEGDLASAGDTTGADTESSGIIAKLPVAPRPHKKGVPIFPETEVGRVLKEQRVVYKILIDFTGAIGDYEVLQESSSPDINASALEALLQTNFNPDSIALDSLNMWYRYDIRITPPAPERNEFDRFNINQNPTRRRDNSRDGTGP